jgi:hypothetical protein
LGCNPKLFKHGLTLRLNRTGRSSQHRIVVLSKHPISCHYLFNCHIYICHMSLLVFIIISKKQTRFGSITATIKSSKPSCDREEIEIKTSSSRSRANNNKTQKQIIPNLVNHQINPHHVSSVRSSFDEENDNSEQTTTATTSTSNMNNATLNTKEFINLNRLHRGIYFNGQTSSSSPPPSLKTTVCNHTHYPPQHNCTNTNGEAMNAMNKEMISSITQPLVIQMQTNIEARIDNVLKEIELLRKSNEYSNSNEEEDLKHSKAKGPSFAFPNGGSTSETTNKIKSRASRSQRRKKSKSPPPLSSSQPCNVCSSRSRSRSRSRSKSFNQRKPSKSRSISPSPSSPSSSSSSHKRNRRNYSINSRQQPTKEKLFLESLLNRNSVDYTTTTTSNSNNKRRQKSPATKNNRNDQEEEEEHFQLLDAYDNRPLLFDKYMVRGKYIRFLFYMGKGVLVANLGIFE